jgi:hypothetical protein
MAWLSRFRPRRGALPESFLGVVSSRRDDGSRLALANFVKEDPRLRGSVVERFGSSSAGGAVNKEAVASFLTKYGMSVAEQGNYLRASSALLFALLVVPDSLEAVAGMAILYHAWEDKIAARWAEHFNDLTSGEMPAHAYLAAAGLPEKGWSEQMDLRRRQMRAIAHDCQLHPEWRDSSRDVQKFGMKHEGRYGSRVTNAKPVKSVKPVKGEAL